MLSHTWSLAVEEQFYLFWPWLVLFVNKRKLPYMIILFIIVGIISQLLLGNSNLNKVITTSCFDAFGLGALLSWFIIYKIEWIHNYFYTSLKILSIIIIPFLLLDSLKLPEFLPLRTAHSIISLWVITYIYLYHDSKSLNFKFILNNKFLIFIGKISYGIYLYHNLIPHFTKLFKEKVIYPFINGSIDVRFDFYFSLISNLILLILIAYLSFVLIEKKFLKLKKNYNYKKENNLSYPKVSTEN